jgi:outer membrane immunogenic protein
MPLKLAGFVAAAFGLVAAQNAFAADMPAKAPIVKAPMAVATSWTGFYVNGGIGYGMWAADTTDSIPATGTCVFCETQVQGGKGWLATIGAGYDYQFAPKIVAGIFGEASISSLKGTIQDRAIPGQGEIKQTSFWAAGGRVGWLVTPQTLSYVNVGYTAARFSDANLGNFITGAPSGFSTPGFAAV